MNPPFTEGFKRSILYSLLILLGLILLYKGASYSQASWDHHTQLDTLVAEQLAETTLQRDIAYRGMDAARIIINTPPVVARDKNSGNILVITNGREYLFEGACNLSF